MRHENNQTHLPAMAGRGYIAVDTGDRGPGEVGQGYWLGAQLLNFLVPAGNNQETYTVPVRLDPCERTVPDGMRMAEVIRVINDAAAASDLVALTIADPMPRTAIRLQMILEQLPLITSSAMR